MAGVLLVGAGGVGSAFARIAARRDTFEHIVVADHSLARAERAAQAAGDRFEGISLDAADECRHRGTAAGHALRRPRQRHRPRLSSMPCSTLPLHAGVNYLDMAMSLSHLRTPRTCAYHQTGVKLGDEQFDLAAAWEGRGQLALVGMGVEPGLSDIFARYASADRLFLVTSRRSGCATAPNLVVESGYEPRSHLLDLDHDRGVPRTRR